MRILILSEPTNGYDDFQSQNGVTFIDLKGTHQQNPFNGFAVSVAPDGLPNLVEGKSKTPKKDNINKVGEVILNGDYVLSDRLKVDNDKELIKKYGLKEGTTYAEAFRKAKAVKEAEDRPNDLISKDTLEQLKQDFINSQEAYKASKEEKKDQRAFNSLTPDLQLGLLDYINSQQQVPEQQMGLGDIQFGTGGKIHIKPENRGKFTASAKRAGMGVQEFARHVLANKEDYSTTQIKRANFARNASKWKHALGGHLFDGETELTGEVKTDSKGSWLAGLGMFAPVASNLFNLATLKKPDYSGISRAEEAILATPIAVAPTINKYYAQYNPIDTNYLMNRYAQLAAANRTLAREQSANRANVLANVLGVNAQTQGLMGQAYLQAQMANQQQKEALRQYLSGIDLANAEATLQVQRMNQARQQAIASALMQGADFREGLRGSYEQTKSGLIGGIGANIGDIAKEALQRKMVSSIGPYGYGLGWDVLFNKQ